jgi:hypothetical protein
MRTLRVSAAVLIMLVACGSPQSGVAPPAAPTPTFAHGVSVNHWLADNHADYQGQSAIPHTYAAAWFDEEDVAWIARHGFDHIQLGVSVTEWTAPDGRLDDAKLAPFEQALGWARQHQLGVVVTFAVLPAPAGMEKQAWRTFASEPALAHYAATIGRIAQRYAAEGPYLRFRLARFAEISPNLNEAYRRAVASIRATSPTRFVYLAPAVRPAGDAYMAPPGATFEHIAELQLPDANVGIALAYWEPEAFTFQTDPERPRVRYPLDPPDQPGAGAGVEADFAVVAAYMNGPGRGHEIYLAEFGVRDLADVDSTRRYLRTVIDLAARHGIHWAIFDYESGGSMRGPTGAPTVRYEATGLRPRSP